MNDEAVQVRRQLDKALADSAKTFRGGQFFIGGVGLVVIVGGFVREIPWLSAIGLVFFGGLVGLMVHSERRTRNHPLRRSILEQPERILRITYRRASSSSGAFPTHWLAFADDSGQSLALRFEPGLIEALAPFLARHFVNAKIEIPGFTPPQ